MNLVEEILFLALIKSNKRLYNWASTLQIRKNNFIKHIIIFYSVHNMKSPNYEKRNLKFLNCYHK